MNESGVPVHGLLCSFVSQMLSGTSQLATINTSAESRMIRAAKETLMCYSFKYPKKEKSRKKADRYRAWIPRKQVTKLIVKGKTKNVKSLEITKREHT